MPITIRKVRGNLGLSQKKMAEVMGMTRSMVGKIESGVEGRTETKGHMSHLIALELIFEHGLLKDLQSKLEGT